jgi:hypothetical protein
MWRSGYDDRWLGARNLSCFRLGEDFSQTRFVSSAHSGYSESAGDHNSLDVHDLSVRCSPAIEGAGVSPPKVRSTKRIFGRR